MEGIFIHFIKEHKRAPKNFWPIAITLRTPSEVELKHSTKFQIFSVAFSFCVPKVGTKQWAFFVVLFLHLLSFFFHPQKTHVSYSGFKQLFFPFYPYLTVRIKNPQEKFHRTHSDACSKVFAPKNSLRERGKARQKQAHGATPSLPPVTSDMVTAHYLVEVGTWGKEYFSTITS